MHFGLALLLVGCSTTVEGGLRLCSEYTPREIRELERDFVSLWRLAELERPELVEMVLGDTDIVCSDFVSVLGLGVVYGVTHSPRDVEIATVDPGTVV